ncbi:MAG: ABC transporter ATP-binding protein [Chloroflexi bacterium]|nr:ABC transporter ATP-binding protein [Chloroflexota bacterium]
MAEVRLDRVTKRYRGLSVNALQETSLTFKDGLFTCVLGPSGSGKSTILKLLAGIEEVTSGRIYFDGVEVTQVTPERRDVAMVFQSYALYPNMTARDNIAFPLQLRGLSRRERYRRVDEVAAMLGIGATLDRHPRQLSGGERQRVALGRAIVREPKVFLLDEPISNLDANLRMQTREELKRIHAQLKATFIYVTHDQDDASAMGDEVVVMAAGRIHQTAPPADVYHRPADRFVASFLGRLPINFVTGVVSAESGSLVLRTEEGPELDLGSGMNGFAVPRGRVLIGVRPEAVLATRADVGGPGVLGTVTLTEVVPPDKYVTASVEGWSVRARVDDADNLAPGDAVRLGFKLSSLHFFDLGSEQRLETELPARAGELVEAP